MLSVKQEDVNTNFKVIGLTRLGIKPESTGPEADAFTTRPSELLCTGYYHIADELAVKFQNCMQLEEELISKQRFFNLDDSLSALQV